MGHRNPKSGQGDGAGFGRLRAAQKQRADFHHKLSQRNLDASVYIDQIREYAGACVVFYRIECDSFEEARVAAFQPVEAGYKMINDIMVAEGETK